MNIGSAMTENVLEADSEYAEVAEKYEEDVLIIAVLKAFTNFLMSGSYPRKPRCITPTFHYFFSPVATHRHIPNPA
jgi:hypothetical protein